jgi:hypothetical protein
LILVIYEGILGYFAAFEKLEAVIAGGYWNHQVAGILSKREAGDGVAAPV